MDGEKFTYGLGFNEYIREELFREHANKRPGCDVYVRWKYMPLQNKFPYDKMHDIRK